MLSCCREAWDSGSSPVPGPVHAQMVSTKHKSRQKAQVKAEQAEESFGEGSTLKATQKKMQRIRLEKKRMVNGSALSRDQPQRGIFCVVLAGRGCVTCRRPALRPGWLIRTGAFVRRGPGAGAESGGARAGREAPSPHSARLGAPTSRTSSPAPPPAAAFGSTVTQPPKGRAAA
eukprot:scaffold2298_cov388-Prasinococcus_capsulatus_cf.AAC.1